MLVVQKFGGTSVKGLERIDNVVKRIIQTKKDLSCDLIVIVSAMGGVTNELIENAKYFSQTPNPRDYDMLLSAGERITSSLVSIALNAKGFKAIALSGRGAGILTDDFHTKARIKAIDKDKIRSFLDDGNIVVVAGFQGINSKGDVTTLGRGGSDLSAVAIAGVMEADFCEIYTDVDGVFTTDPKIEPNAKKIDKISYDEMLELSSLGAKVLQNRSVELAKKLNLEIVTKNSFNLNSGTLITSEVEKEIISGIALDENQVKFDINSDKKNIDFNIFSLLASSHINVDMIFEINENDKTSLSFTISKSDLVVAKDILGDISYKIDEDIIKLSIIGIGMRSIVISKALEVLSKNGIKIVSISTSEIKISMLLRKKDGKTAINLLHKIYNLDK